MLLLFKLKRVTVFHTLNEHIYSLAKWVIHHKVKVKLLTLGQNQELSEENVAAGYWSSAGRQTVLQTELEILLNSDVGAPQTWRNFTLASVGFPALDYGRTTPSQSSRSPNIPTKQKHLCLKKEILCPHTFYFFYIKTFWIEES